MVPQCGSCPLRVNIFLPVSYTPSLPSLRPRAPYRLKMRIQVEHRLLFFFLTLEWYSLLKFAFIHSFVNSDENEILLSFPTVKRIKHKVNLNLLRSCSRVTEATRGEQYLIKVSVQTYSEVYTTRQTNHLTTASRRS